MINCGYAYNKLLLEKFIDSRKIKDFKVTKAEIPKLQGLNITSLHFQILYPGLIAGVGYPHDLKDSELWRLGMHFDYTTGLPCIPGSSVKGILRQAYENEELDKKQTSIKNIFESNKVSFFNAFFYNEAKGKGKANSLFKDDYVTDHSYRDADYSTSLVKEPQPIKFLKINPGGFVSFQFLFSDTMEKKEKDEILSQFKEYLKIYGIGAKRNVGYGQLRLLSHHMYG